LHVAHLRVVDQVGHRLHLLHSRGHSMAQQQFPCTVLRATKLNMTNIILGSGQRTASSKEPSVIVVICYDDVS
jgi:hypothetical protein